MTLKSSTIIFVLWALTFGLFLGGCGGPSQPKPDPAALIAENNKLTEQNRKIQQDRDALAHENQRKQNKLEAIFAIVRIVVYFIVAGTLWLMFKYHGRARSYIEEKPWGKKALVVGLVIYVIYDVMVNSALIIDWLKGPILQ